MELGKSSILNSFIFNSDSPGGARTADHVRVLRSAGRLAGSLSRGHREGDDGASRRGEEVPAPGQVVDPGGRSREGRDKPLSTLGTVKQLDITIPEPPSGSPGTCSVGHARCRGRRSRPRQQGRRRHGRRGGRSTGSRPIREERTAVSATTPQGDIELQSTTVLDGAAGSRCGSELVTPMGAMTMTDCRRPPAPIQGGPQGSQAAAGGAADARCCSRSQRVAGVPAPAPQPADLQGERSRRRQGRETASDSSSASRWRAIR